MHSRDWARVSELAVVVIMMTTVLALYMPGHLRTVPLIPALIYILLNRKEVEVDVSIKTWAILFISYVAIFTLLAENPTTAWKGVYDIIRGCLYFFTGYFFGIKLQSEKHYPWLLLIVAVVLAGNFLDYHEASVSDILHGGFYGYHPNPNSSAFVVVVLLAFVLPALFLSKKPATSLLTGMVGIGMGLILLYYANSRSAWVAVFIGLTALGITTLRNKRTLLLALGFAEVILLAVVLLYFNQKGFSIPVRLDTWIRLIEITANEHIWLGYGINNTKEVLANAGMTVLLAHNLLVDIFTSTGIIGTLIFIALCIRLVLILARINNTVSIAFQVGLSGLTMFFFISMFDLKFASLTLIGTFAFFSGVIYSQSAKTEGY